MEPTQRYQIITTDIGASEMEIGEMALRFYNVEDAFVRQVLFDDILGITKSKEDTLIIKTFEKQRVRFGFCYCRRMEKRVIGQIEFTLKDINNHEDFVTIISQKVFPKKRKLLVLVNPFGGAGAAPGNWQIANQLFVHATQRTEITVMETERANHAFEYVQEILQDKFDGIVTVSGDGLLHEVVNGLMKRKDWLEIRDKVTIGGIPGGTGNGLIKALLHNQNENSGIHEAAYLIIRGRRSFMDLTELKLQYHLQPIYSFLSVCWAVIADCDLNSESLRCLGPIRFTIWGVWRCLALIRYQGTFSCNGVQIRNRNEYPYIEIGNKSAEFNQEAKEDFLKNSTEQLLEWPQEQFTHFAALNVAWISSSINIAPLAKPNDGTNDIIMSRTAIGAGRCALIRMLIDQDDGAYFQANGNIRPELRSEYLKAQTWMLDPHIKGPHPDHLPEEGYQYNVNAVLSIDGEKYPAQKVEAKVLKNALPFYF